jgi:hypothetical protein
VHLNVGDQLLVQFSPFGDRLAAVVVDRDPGKSLSIFLRLPPPLLRHVQSGCDVAAQYVHESTLMGFHTTIRTCCTSPTCVLALHWPESVVDQDPRREKRLDCNFPGTLTVDGRPFRCMVENLSASAVRVRLLQETDLRVLPCFDDARELCLDFFALEERNRYTFSCTHLREFIRGARRHVVLLLGEAERDMRRVLESYVDQVLNAPEPVSEEN